MVPIAAPKGTSTMLTFSVSCNASDSCLVTGSGLAKSASYQLEVTDSCGALLHSGAVNTSGTGTLDYTVVAGESAGCSVTGWTFSLFTIGRKPSQVATYLASDPD